MTQPLEPTAGTQDLLDAESLALEEAAEAAVTATLTAAVTGAALALTALLVELTAGGAALTVSGARRLQERARELYGGIRPEMGAALQRWVARGMDLGEDQANQVLIHPVAPPQALIVDQDLVQVVAEVDDRARDNLQRTVALVDALPFTSAGDVQTVVAVGRRTSNVARQDVRWAVNRAINSGAATVTLAAGMNLLWVAERDACLHCLAYSGHVVRPGALFPADLTYADHPIRLPAVPYPPRHPNCRCRVQPYDGEPGRVDMSHPSAPTALLREARRSVVYGWSAYDSEAARLRAVERLLAVGASLPKSVEARGRAAVRRGRFK